MTKIFTIGALLLAVTAAQAHYTVPIHSGGVIKFVWVGDLDGNGTKDFVLDRNTANPQTIEAYTDKGVFMWGVSFGNSSNQDNISPGSGTIDVASGQTLAYGGILADNGGDWFISGAPDPRWNDDNLNTLKKVKGSDLEVVKMGPLTSN